MSRLISKKEVRQLVVLSSTQIGRLEQEGKFPKRVRIGTYRNSRAVWVEDEVQDWIRRRIAERDRPTDTPE